jgi:arginine/lysine/histidine transporter system substrate-binding protein
MIKKIIICLLLLTMVSCQDKNQEETLRMGTSPDYPPFEYKRDGEIVGFDIALAKALADRLGKKLEIHELDFNSLIPALQSGKLDFVASGLTITPERLANVDFSNIYYRTSIAAIFKTGKEITSVSEFANKKIGAQLGSTMENFVKDQQNQLANVSISSLANNLHLLQELKLDRIDVLLLEEGQVNDILSANPGLASIILPKTGDGYALGFAKNSPLTVEFNQALNSLEMEGKIIEIEGKWLKSDQLKSTDLMKALKSIPAGIFVTLQYALISVFLGLIIGSILSLFKVSSNKILRAIATCYLSIFRGTPLLVQLSFMYFAMPSLLGIEISAFTAGIIAFSLNSGAYISENIRAGIESVDKGQFEASKSLGMPYKVMMRYIIMPQAIRNILPSLVNESINLVKESAIISVIGEADIMRRANIVAAEQYSFLEPLLVAAVCYYILVMIMTLLAKLLEKRLKRI